jgi:hypothetical protein
MIYDLELEVELVVNGQELLKAFYPFDSKSSKPQTYKVLGAL